MGGGGGRAGEGGRNYGLIVVRVCDPVFRSLPHSYTMYLAYEKTDPFIYLIIRNVDLFIYCPLIFIPIYCW